MKNLGRYLVLSTMILFLGAALHAQDKKSTPKDAEAIVKKAIEYIKANGAEKAFKEFSNPKGKFIEGDLYISVYDMKGFCVAHPDPKKNKVDLLEEKDPTGKFVIKERLALAKQSGKGWANYKGKKLGSDQFVDKTVYVEKYNEYIICCAVYGFMK